VSANLARNVGGLALVAALATWVAFQLHWETITVRTPAKGEALTNPYYALEHFVTNLGLHPQEISSVRGLQPEAVLVLEEWGDELTHPPVAALESWVESGGRLVISSALLDSYPALRAWSGIKRARAARAPAEGQPTASPAPGQGQPATPLAPGQGQLAAPPAPQQGQPAAPPAPEQRKPTAPPAPEQGKPAAPPAPEQGKPAASPPGRPATAGSDCPLMTARADGVPTGQSFRVCNARLVLDFDADHLPAWSLSDERGMHVIRTGVGFGEITVLAPPNVLSNEILGRADHAEMFAAAAGLRHEDTLLIFHPATALPLPVLLWRLVAPGILFLLAALLALAWRHAPRFGPPLPLASPLRRSLAEQIRANARFAWRTRSLGGLRTSARRSLDEVAARHIAGYGSLDASQRAKRLAELTGLDPTAIRAARDEGAQRLNEERAAMTLMEVCRRILLRMHSDHPRPLV
jgi:hypothetical protein